MAFSSSHALYLPPVAGDDHYVLHLLVGLSLQLWVRVLFPSRVSIFSVNFQPRELAQDGVGVQYHLLDFLQRGLWEKFLAQ